MGSIILVVDALVNEEKKVGPHKCTQCGKIFERKELHLQEVLVINNPNLLEVESEGLSKFYGEPITFHNLFVLRRCPFCKFHNQRGTVIGINCKLKHPKEVTKE